MHVETEEPERGYCPCGKNPPSVLCQLVPCSLPSPSSGILQHTKLPSSFPGRGVCLMANSGLLGQTQTPQHTPREPRVQLQHTDRQTDSHEAAFAALCKPGAAQRAGRFPECSLACTFTPSEWTHSALGGCKLKTRLWRSRCFPAGAESILCCLGRFTPGLRLSQAHFHPYPLQHTQDTSGQAGNARSSSQHKLLI